jgi:hypothetical protein
VGSDVTHDDGRDKEKEDLPPGGAAMQRRRAFLEQRGLPLDEELEDEATREEEDEDPPEGEEESKEDRTPEKGR